MEQEQAKFSGWAIVEIFGHQRYAGYVQTEAYGQAVMFRVDVPPLPERERITRTYEYVDDQPRAIPPGSTVKEAAIEGFTKLFGAGSIYAMTPCTQEAAEKALEKMQSRKLQLVKLAEERAIGAAPIDGEVSGDDFDEFAPHP